MHILIDLTVSEVAAFLFFLLLVFFLFVFLVDLRWYSILVKNKVL